MPTLDKFRTDRGLTLEALAEFLGLPYNTVVSLACGRRLPSLGRAWEIHRKTGGAVALADWFPGDGWDGKPSGGPLPGQVFLFPETGGDSGDLPAGGAP